MAWGDANVTLPVVQSIFPDCKTSPFAFTNNPETVFDHAIESSPSYLSLVTPLLEVSSVAPYAPAPPSMVDQLLPSYLICWALHSFVFALAKIHLTSPSALSA